VLDRKAYRKALEPFAKVTPKPGERAMKACGTPEALVNVVDEQRRRSNSGIPVTRPVLFRTARQDLFHGCVMLG
jgi:hypothetical protein